jgi:hypothetical protein
MGSYEPKIRSPAAFHFEASFGSEAPYAGL